LLLAWTACGDEQPAARPDGVGDAAKGQAIYANVCATCHGADPTQAGTIGPPIAGSSPALVEAKVLRGEYPPGYTPKRGNSRAMPPLPYLKDNIADIAAYLQAAGG
jgi:mono/diheme cytochrome c family protein